MKICIFSPLSVVLFLMLFAVGCQKTNEPTPKNEIVKTTQGNKNSSILIFQELKLATEAHMSVIQAKYTSIEKDQRLVQSLIQDLNAYSQMAPEKIDLASVATTLGFENENAYISSLTRIQNATLAIKGANPNSSDSELLEIIKDELGLNPEDDQPGDNQIEGKLCGEIYNSEVYANAAAALVNYSACSLGSFVCTGFYFGCLAGCYAGVAANHLAQNNASYVRLLACLQN